jgi:hypothetical protein
MPVVDYRIDDLDWTKWTVISASNLSRSPLIWRLRQLAPAEGGAGLRSRWRVTTERGGSSEFEFSEAMVVGFWWGLLLRDHRNEGNLIMLTIFGGGRQWSLAMVRWLGQCLVTVRAASGEALTPKTCAEASSNSLLAFRPTNCFERRRKTRIWWPPRVSRVLDLQSKIRTIGSAIYTGF